MKFNMKAVVASVLFAVAGSSQAAILDGFSASEDGDIFISILRDTATPQSMIINTHLSIFDLRDGITTSWTSSATQTTAILNFLGTSALSDFRFNAGGVSNQADFFDVSTNNNYGAVLSSNGAFSSLTLDSSNVETFRSNIHTFETEINNVYASTDVITGLTPSSPGFHNAFSWGDHVGGALPSISTAAGVGTALDLWYVFNGDTGPDFGNYSTAYQKFGQLNIDAVTGVASFSSGAVSAVPVPAAVWLMGSGLVGLVGVARRKAA